MRRKAMRLLIALLFSIFVISLMVAQVPPLRERVEALLNLSNDPFRADAIVDPPFTSLTYGIQAFMWWYDDLSTIHMEWVKLLGFTHVKQKFAWRDIQPQPDLWMWGRSDRLMRDIEQHDLQIVVRLGSSPDWAHPGLNSDEDDTFLDAPPDDLGLWVTYCRNVAERYHGQIAAYQIWNEPNLAREWGNRTPNAADYVELLRLCSEAIRTADPDAIIISAGLAPNGQNDNRAQRDDWYLQAMYDADFQNYIDVVGVHSPGFTPAWYGPDRAVQDGGDRWQSFRRIEDLRKIMVRNGDAARQMAILEMGFTSDPIHEPYQWFSVHEITKAALMVEAYDYAAQNWRPWVGLISAIYLAEPGWTQDNEEFWWAFNDPITGVMRPVFGAVAQMEKYCGDVYVPPRSPEESAYAPEHNPCS